MKTFLKWTGRGFIFLLITFTLSDLKRGEFDSSRIPKTIFAIVGGSISLGLLFYLVQFFYIPWRKRRVQKNIVRLFHGNPISDDVTEFELYGFTFLAKFQYDLSINMHGKGNTEIVNFHIPREQITNLTRKPKVDLKPDFVNGIATYHVLQTHGMSLRLGKKKLLKKFDPANYYTG